MDIVKHLDWSTMGSVILVGLLYLLLSELFRLYFPANKVPPGPRPLLFIGNIIKMMNDPQKTILELTKYGEISSLYLGRQPSIVLNHLHIAKEMLLQNVFSGRPSLPVVDWITNRKGIVMAPSGNIWKQQRRFALQTLRDFGLGKKSLEERVSEEARYLIDELEKLGGKPFNPHSAIQNAVSNIISSIVFGNRFDYDNKRFLKLLKLINENVILAGSPMSQVFNLVPWIKYFPGPHQKIKRNADKLKCFIKHSVKEHSNTLDEGNLRDFIDAYIVQIERQKSNTESTFSEENMILSVADLFMAGTDTTATAIRWGLIYLMEHQDIQERCHQEIAQVIGYDRPATMEDRVNLPYVYATIHEIQRVGNITPLGVMHENIEATQLSNYHLPKGTQVFVNVAAILSDKDHWKFPDTFNPENFLDEKGQFCKQESFLVFSLGPRVCLGEQLARMELFLFFTALLQRLRFSWPPGTDSPDLDGVFSFVRTPKPFTVLCQRWECNK